MKTTSRILLMVLVLAGVSAAVQPQKAAISKYTNLWMNSPFTSKPPVESGPIVNPLEDYALGGISPVNGGYRVTLFNKKKPEDRITLDPNAIDPKHDFKILGVERKEGNPLATIVRLSSGSMKGSVAFDEKLLTLAPAAPANVAAARPPQPMPQTQPVPQPGQQQPRQPRPRVVPPTTGGQPGQPGMQQPQSMQQRGGGDRRSRR